jgi:hypothetical protein
MPCTDPSGHAPALHEYTPRFSGTVILSYRSKPLRNAFADEIESGTTCVRRCDRAKDHRCTKWSRLSGSKIADQEEFVAWWKKNVSVRHGGDTKNADRRSCLSVEAAEKALPGLSHASGSFQTDHGTLVARERCGALVSNRRARGSAYIGIGSSVQCRGCLWPRAESLTATAFVLIRAVRLTRCNCLCPRALATCNATSFAN